MKIINHSKFQDKSQRFIRAEQIKNGLALWTQIDNRKELGTNYIYIKIFNSFH